MADFKPESLDAAQDVLSDLKERAKDAENKGDVFTFGIMNELIKVVSPIVTKAHARLIREERAQHNAAFMELKKKFREDKAKQPRLQRD